MNKEELRKEWNEYCGGSASNKIADWWLNKLDLQRDNFIKMIEDKYYGANDPKVTDILKSLREIDKE